MSAFPELHRLYEDTLSLGALCQHNWDGGPALPIDPHAIAKGLQLLETLSLYLKPNTVEPRPNGRIQYRWTNDKGDLLLEVVPHAERYIYQFVSLHSAYNQGPSSPQPVTSVQDFLYQILIPFLLPLKPVVVDNKGPIYRDQLPHPL